MAELVPFTRRLGILLIALVVLIVAGTLGYAATEGTSVPYGFAWTLDTVTTLGSIPQPRDTGGRVLQVCLELLGIGTLFYALATVAEFFVTGQLTGLLAVRRRQRMIDAYTDHFIICGYGRVGKQVVRDLHASHAQCVVIDPDPKHAGQAADDDVPVITAVASDDEVLRQAGIERAAAVLACVDSDAENIFITLSARELRTDVQIIARASREDSEKKLLRAGADRVISPYKTSGHEMARVALHPQVAGVVDVDEYRMEEIEVSSECAGAGRTIEDVRGGSVIVALRRADGRLEPQPAPSAVIGVGDHVIALGTPDSLGRLEGIFQPAGAST
jgi:voltage-gated potassium channel